MATRTWVSSGSTDFDTAGNWSGGAAPTNSDDIVFDGNSSNINCTSGMDQSASGTWGTGTKLIVRPNYTGTIGGSGSPLSMNFTGILNMRGAGDEFWFQNLNATGVLRAFCSPQQLEANACQLDGEFIRIVIASGRVQIAASATVDDGGGGDDATVLVYSDPNIGVAPYVTVGAATVSDSVRLVMLAGQVDSSAAWPTLIMSNGDFRHEAGTIARAYTTGGKYRANAGTTTDLECWNTEFDGATYAGWTVTNMWAGGGSILDLRNGQDVVPTNLYRYEPLDVHYDAGES